MSSVGLPFTLCTSPEQTTPTSKLEGWLPVMGFLVRLNILYYVCCTRLLAEVMIIVFFTIFKLILN